MTLSSRLYCFVLALLAVSLRAQSSRAEVFNVRNTPPLGQPNAAFGSITTAGNSRPFEFAARFKF